MKPLVYALAISSLSVGVARSEADENISGTVKKLRSLRGEERVACYGTLSEETKKGVQEYERDEGRKMKKRLDAIDAKVKAFHLSNKFIDFYMAYESAARKLVSQIADPELRKAEEVRMREKVREFGWAVDATPPPLIGGLWEKHGKRLKAAWEPYQKRRPNAEELHRIETGVLEPIIRDARKIIEAEPEGDKLWFLRKKWQYLFKEEEGEPGDPAK